MTVIARVPWLGDIGGAIGSARDEVAQEAMARMEPHVPKETGALRGSARVDDGSVVYLEEYAAPVYEAPEGTGWTTEGTGPRWDEKLDDEDMEHIERYALDAILGAMR